MILKFLKRNHRLKRKTRPIFKIQNIQSIKDLSISCPTGIYFTLDYCRYRIRLNQELSPWLLLPPYFYNILRSYYAMPQQQYPFTNTSSLSRYIIILIGLIFFSYTKLILSRIHDIFKYELTLIFDIMNFSI